MDINKEKTCERLRKLRCDRGLTAQDVGKALKISTNSIYRLESGGTFTGLSILILAYLGADPLDHIFVNIKGKTVPLRHIRDFSAKYHEKRKEKGIEKLS